MEKEIKPELENKNANANANENANANTSENNLENTSVGMDKVDPDLENKEKSTGVSSHGGIETEQYDSLPPPPLNSELAESIEDRVGIEISYSFNGDDVKEGLTAFQSVVLKKRNMIYTVILVLIFVMYALNVVRNPTETLSIVLGVVAVAVLAFVWIMPKTHIKKVAEAADNTENHFTMTVYDNCVRLGADNGSFLLSYEKNITNIFETANLFLVCAGKEQIFILPKREIDPDKINTIRDIFTLQGGVKFKSMV